MDSRERVIHAVEMSGPDRIPVMHNVLHGAHVHHAKSLEDLLRAHPSDFAETGFREPAEFGERPGEGKIDGWGAVWLRTTDEHKGLIVEHPLEDWSALDSYRFPDPLGIGDWSGVPAAIESNRRRRYMLVDGDTLFQRMFYLRGFQNLMMDLGEGRSELYYLRDRILRFMLRKIEKWQGYDIDGFRFRDDWGTQLALMISPAQWREFFKPCYQQLFDAVHSGGQHVWFHSDGFIISIIPDLLEMGADVINPQATCIGIERLGREFGGKVCFLGDIDRQQVLPFGTPDQVREHVSLAIETFGRFHGGYVGQGEIAGDVPLANAEAMYETFAAYRYEEGRLRRS